MSAPQTSPNLQIEADKIILATGTRPRRPSDIRFNENNIVDSDSLLRMTRIPPTLCVMGAGVIGCEYASIFSQLGTKVSIVDRRTDLLRGVDSEIVALLQAKLESTHVKFLLGVTPTTPQLRGNQVLLNIDGVDSLFDSLLYCMGRIGNVESLALNKAGLSSDSRGLLEVNRNFQTQVPHIYAVGDLIGSPALAASASEQGRLAACHAFGLPNPGFPSLFPYGIYTIPEISSVGAEEALLIEAKTPYVVGHARFSEIARGKILGDEFGMLKLIFDRKTHLLLGAHIIGTHATELIHIAQVAMSLGAKIDNLTSLVFNYPTLAEAYKVACLNALNKLRAPVSAS
jgi:NAD(P) transhydrogenase